MKSIPLPSYGKIAKGLIGEGGSDQMEKNGTSQARGTVLIVEDNMIVLKLTRTILEKAGFDVLTATDGIAAVESFRQHAPAITAVVIDLGLPLLSGQEVLAQMQGIRPDVPVILSSGYPEKEALGHFASMGRLQFIQKPYKPKHLLAKLEDLVSCQPRFD
jgi:DNA-binding response OmpR family regulator